MIEDNTMQDLIKDSQEDMNDFVSFEEADMSIEEDPKEEPKEKEEEDIEDDLDEEIDDKKEIKEDLSKDKKDEEEKEIKKFELQNGDDKVELRADSKVLVPIDGKSVEMSLQEVINKASGNMAVDKRFSDLANEKQSHKVEKSQFNIERDELMGKVNSFAEAVNNKDGLGAVKALATLTGNNPIELRQHFKDLMINEVKAYLEMSPENQKEFDIKQERAYYRQERDYFEDQRSVQQANNELETSLINFQTKHGISNADLVALYDRAEEKSLDIQSAEDLESFYNQEQTQEKSSSLISEVDPSLKDDKETLSIVSEFMAKNPEMKDAEVIQAIKNAMGIDDSKEDKQEKSLSDKIKNKQAKNQKGKKPKQEVDFDDEEDDGLTFDDLGY